MYVGLRTAFGRSSSLGWVGGFFSWLFYILLFRPPQPTSQLSLREEATHACIHSNSKLKKRRLDTKPAYLPSNRVTREASVRKDILGGHATAIRTYGSILRCNQTVLQRTTYRRQLKKRKGIITVTAVDKIISIKEQPTTLIVARGVGLHRSLGPIDAFKRGWMDGLSQFVRTSDCSIGHLVNLLGAKPPISSIHPTIHSSL